jgi:XisI protein
MDRLNFCRKTIEAVLKKYSEIPYSCGYVAQYLIIDKDRNHFMLFGCGLATKTTGAWMCDSCANS